jgi:hypothetical protein
VTGVVTIGSVGVAIVRDCSCSCAGKWGRKCDPIVDHWVKKVALIFVVFVVLILFFVLIFGDLEGGAGFGEVEAVGSGVETADDTGGVGFGLDAGGVGGGELEAVEQGGSASGVEVAGSKGIDDDGESDLDGLAVFEGGELNMLTGNEVAACGSGVAEAAVALMEAVVEVAPLLAGEGGCFALDSVGLDVSAELVLHLGSPGVYPPGGMCLKVDWLQQLSDFYFAKFVQPKGLRLNSSK